jgi:putative transposase
MCVKYRNKVINDKISTRLKEIFEKIAPTYNITLEEWNHDIDYVHVLFRGQPNTEISNLSMRINQQAADLSRKSFLRYVNLFGKRYSGHRVFVC